MTQYLNSETAAKLLELNKLLTKSLKLEEVLQNVVNAAGELVAVADTIIIYLLDQSDGKLRLAEGKGINNDALKQVAFSPGESIAGKVYCEKAPKLFSSEQEIDSFMCDMSEKNYQFYFTGIHERKIKSAFCVPILNKDRCLGVLVVDNFKQDGVFTGADLQVIQILAEQSAIAIDNSYVYRSLKEKNDLLAQAADMHNMYYRMIIEGGGVDQIVSLLEAFTETHVTYHATEPYAEDHTLFPIVRGKEVLGTLKLERPFHTFTQIEQAAIEQASLAIAIELMKDHALLAKELQFREEVFNQLMEGIPEYDLDRILRYFDWKKEAAIQCMVIEGRERQLWKQDKLKDKEWFIRSIEEILTSICGKSLVLSRAFQLIMIFPVSDKKTTERVINRVDASFGTGEILFGVGREASVYQIGTSYKEAVRSLNYAKARPGKQVVEYAKLGMERLLYEIDGSTADMYVEDKLGGLLGSEKVYLETLQTFVELNKNHKDTASALHIHPNTLYYRLKRVEKLLNIDLNNEKEWLDLVIALHLYVAGNKS
ncbi:helix-turn-helix domain-containing protein [Virgibacillus kekensis]|uniref:Helix-turn-helix domain-containing protein n=1 Tax=Virgibacillus kekensis TaxID=202261 RepID=A0ABV9DGC4_9BACI